MDVLFHVAPPPVPPIEVEYPIDDDPLGAARGAWNGLVISCGLWFVVLRVLGVIQ